jgi:hypothetical protein
MSGREVQLPSEDVLSQGHLQCGLFTVRLCTYTDLPNNKHHTKTTFTILYQQQKQK